MAWAYHEYYEIILLYRTDVVNSDGLGEMNEKVLIFSEQKNRSGMRRTGYSGSKRQPLGRSLIARGFCLRKIHRRKAKTNLFSWGKSEKRSFSAGERGSPLQSSPKYRFFENLKSGPACAGPDGDAYLREASRASIFLMGDRKSVV